MHADQLRQFLTENKIPLHLWGTGKAKTFEHLIKELAEGEATIELLHNGTVQRRADGAGIIVYYHDGVSRWRLKEDRQVFKDGRTRTRTMTSSIGEKLRPNENPRIAARRALHEELGIDEEIELIDLGPVVKGPVASESYPGTWSISTSYIFETTLPRHLYKTEYVEVQADKTNYYVWVKDEQH